MDGLVIFGSAATLDYIDTLLRSKRSCQYGPGIWLENVVEVAMPAVELLVGLSKTQEVKYGLVASKTAEVAQAEMFSVDDRP